MRFFLDNDRWTTLLWAGLALLLFPAAARAYEPTSHYVIQNIEGWQVYVHRDLLPGGKQREDGAPALRQLKYGLAKMRQTVADGPLEKLQKVKIWLEVDSTNGKHGRTSAYQYHPDLDWLEEMDFHPKKQKCVEFGNAASLAKRSDFKTAQVTMHELAHAYHDQVLTFDDPDVLAAHKRARAEGKYPARDWVVRADHKEFFAGLTTRYFGTEEERAVLVERDPVFAKKLKEYWREPMAFLHTPLRDANLRDNIAMKCPQPAETAPEDAPRMYYADTVSGRPFSKDPAVIRFQGKYWLYYSVPPYEGKPTKGWTIGVATSENLVDWSKAGELRNTGEAEAKGFTAPGATVLEGKVHLFYQTYGNGKRDAICHAWSDDGLKFTRNPTNPIFRPTGQWTVGRAIDADVIARGNKLLLYWATRDPEMKIQMQGVAAAPLDSDFLREDWTQLNPDGPILSPTVPTKLDDPGLDLAWEKRCIEAAAMARHDGRLYMFYAGGYNNDPQQVGVAVSDDGVSFKRLSDKPLVPNGPPGSWNSSESGHPFLFQDDDGQDYLFYQGNNTHGKSWYLSVLPIDWKDGKPVLAPEKLPKR